MFLKMMLAAHPVHLKRFTVVVVMRLYLGFTWLLLAWATDKASVADGVTDCGARLIPVRMLSSMQLDGILRFSFALWLLIPDLLVRSILVTLGRVVLAHITLRAFLTLIKKSVKHVRMFVKISEGLYSPTPKARLRAALHQNGIESSKSGCAWLTSSAF